MDWTGAYEVQPSPTSNGSNWFYWNISTLKETIYFHDMFHVHWEDLERTSLESLGFSVSRNFTPKEIPAEEESINQTLIIEVRPKEKDKILYAGAEYRQDLISAILLEYNHKEHVITPSFFMPYNWTVEWRIEPPLKDVYTFQATFKLTRKQGVTGVIEVIPRFRADLRDQTVVNVPNADSVSTLFEVGNISVVTRDSVDWSISHEKSRTVLFSSQEQVKTKPSENVTIYDGDLIIDTYKKLVIRNCTWIQRGNILVKDYAKLTTESATIIMPMVTSWGPRELVRLIEVLNSGYLEMRETELKSDEMWTKWTMINLGDSAYAEIIHSSVDHVCLRGRSVLIANQSVIKGRLSISESSRAMLLNSSVSGHPGGHSYVSLDLPSLVEAKFDLLKPRMLEYWNLHENVTVSGVAYTIEIRNSYIGNWELFVDYKAKLSISDSEIFRFILNFHETTFSMKGLKPGYIQNWSRQSIVLQNTYVTLWDIRLSTNTIGTIENSQIAILSVSYGGRLSLIDSTIYDHFLGSGHGQIDFNNATWSADFFLDHSRLVLSGDVNLSDIRVRHWYSSNITRNYGVIVRDAYGKFVSNAILTLKLKDEALVWNGTMDAQGRVNFNITFNDANYMDFWILTVSIDKWNVSKQIKFLMDTPVKVTLDNMPPNVELTKPVNGSVVYSNITIKAWASDNVQLKTIQFYVDDVLIGSVETSVKSETAWASFNTRTLPNGTHVVTVIVHDVYGNANGTSIVINVQNILEDLNGDGVVNIIDVATVARAFGSKPGDPMWNPAADLDNNGEVNIVDVSMVARNFGKKCPCEAST
jgi:hypothetical protein